MKKHFFISIFALLSLSFVLVQCNKEDSLRQNNETTELQTRNTSEPDCLPSLSTGCLQINDTIKVTISMALYNFNNCTFKVGFRMQKCFINNEWVYNFSNFEILEHNCLAFNEALQNLIGFQLEEFLRSFNKKIRNAIVMPYLEEEEQTEGRRGNYNYYYASCIKACISEPIHPGGGGKGGGNGISYILVWYQKCGEDCCRDQTIYEYRNGQWNLISRGTIGSGELCDPNFDYPCGLGVAHETDCFVQCDEQN